MREVFRLVGKIALDGTVELNEKLQAIDKRANQVSRSLNKMGKDLTKIGMELTKSVTVPLAAAGVAIVKGIDLASDLSETIAKTGELFGSSAGQIEEWASTAAEKFGQSKNQAMDAASTFAIFGRSAGLAGNDLVQFSTQFTELASDLASFNNTTPEDAIVALGAAMRGEMEPIRRYGVLLDDASMRQKALEMGITNSINKALTPQQKVLAASALIMEQTTAAQGDFERQSEGLANMQRILKAEITDMATELSTAFLPIAQQVVGFVREKILPSFQGLVDWFTSLNPQMRENVVILAGLAAGFGPVLMIVGKLATGFGGLIPLIAKLVTGQLSLNAAMSANPIGVVVTAVYLLITAGILLWKNWDTVKNFMLDAWDAIAYGVQQAVSYLKTMIFSYIKMWVDGINIVAKYIPGLNNAIESAQNKLQELIDTEKENIQYRREAREETKAYNDELERQDELIESVTKTMVSKFESMKKAAKETGEAFDENAVQIRLYEEAIQSLIEQGIDPQNGKFKMLVAEYKALVKATTEQTQAVKEQTQATQGQAEATEELARKRAELEERYTKKVFEQSASRIEILEAEMEEELAKADELDADRTNIRAYYETEISRIRKEEADKRIEIMHEEAEEEKRRNEEAAAKIQELLEKRQTFEDQWNQKQFEASADRMEILEAEMQDALAKAEELGASEAAIVAYYEQKKRELRRETFNSYLSTASDMLGRLDSIFGQHYTNRNAEIDNWYQNEKNAVDASLMTEEEKEAAIKQLDEERDARKREIARKQAATEKATSLFSIAINTARAIVEALPNVVLAGVIGAMGAAQAALVAAEPLPELKTGGLAIGETAAIVGDTPRRERGELIMPMRTGVEMLADMLISRLSQVTLPRPAFAMAGGVSNAYDNRTEVHLHVGTLIADEPGLKKLERKLAEIRLMENRRRGIR